MLLYRLHIDGLLSTGYLSVCDIFQILVYLKEEVTFGKTGKQFLVFNVSITIIKK